MKTIKIKEFTIDMPNGITQRETTAGLLFKALDYAPRKTGVTIKEMGKRLEIAKKLEIADKSVDLENAEIILLATLYNEMPWLVINEEIYNLGKELETLKAECN